MPRPGSGDKLPAPAASASARDGSATDKSPAAKPYSKQNAKPHANAKDTLRRTAVFFRSAFSADEAEAVLAAFYGHASQKPSASSSSDNDSITNCVFLASRDDAKKCAKCGGRRKKHGTITRRHQILPRNAVSYRMNRDDLAQLSKLPEEVIANIFELFDRDGDGQIDKNEFGTFVLLCTKGSASDKLSTLFRLFDSQQAGKMSKIDLQLLFETVLATTSKLGTEQETNAARIDILLEQALQGKNSLAESDFVDWAAAAPAMSMFLRHLADAWLQAPVTDLKVFQRDSADKRYRILALDGGGVRGVMQAVFIARIEQEFPGFIDSVDFFSGTSVGALLACSYALGYPPEKVKLDFTKETPRRLSSTKSKKFDDYKQMFFAARYDNTAFKQGAIKAFGDLTLKDLRKRVLIPTFKLKDVVHSNTLSTPTLTLKDASAQSSGRKVSKSKKESKSKEIMDADANIAAEQQFSWAPKFYHNFHDGHATERVADVCLRSMAAPTYFPSYQGHIDGGVVANNPGMVAITSAISQRYAGRDLNDLVLLSIGCGDKQAFIDTDDLGDESGELNWSLKQWARPLLQIMAQASAATVNTQCHALLNDRYYRLSPVLQGKIGSLDPRDLHRLQQFAEEISLDHIFAWLTEHWF